MLDSLVRVSRRGKISHFVSATEHNRDSPQSNTGSILSVIYHPTGATFTDNAFPVIKLALTHAQSQCSCLKRHKKYDGALDTGLLCFPFGNFRYSLTLFSKFFASFPHGTCMLSVSHTYLALDGIYHPT